MLFWVGVRTRVVLGLGIGWLHAGIIRGEIGGGAGVLDGMRTPCVVNTQAKRDCYPG